MKCFIFAILSFLSVCSASCVIAQTGIITTVAGNGYVLDTGNGGQATAASICASYPSQPDSRGNQYVAERFCHSLRVISPSGIITHFAGTGIRGYSGHGGAATAAKLNNPLSMILDDSDNLYVAEIEGCRIRKINYASGNIFTYAGNGVMVDSGDGNIATNAAIKGPVGICFDANMDMYIACASGRIRKIDHSTHVIHRIAGTGVSGYSGDGGPATAAQVNLQGLCVDLNGNVYTAEWGNARIRKINVATGIITTVAGNGSYGFNGEGLVATAAQISPYDVKADADGNLIFADMRNQRVRSIDLSGRVNTIAGTGTAGFSGDGGPATAAKMYHPEGLALDDCNNIYFDDNANNRIRKITANVPATPSISIASSVGNNLCYGMPITFTPHTTYAGRIPTYQWIVNGLNVGASIPTYTYSPANGDSVQCQLTSSLTCLTTSPIAMSNTVYMRVDSLFAPVVALGGDTVVAAGATVHLTATITGGSSTYTLHWKNHGVEFATTTTPSVTYTKSIGIDTITAIVTSTGRGCYDSVVSVGHWVWDHNLSVGSWQSVVGSLRVYPNPVGNELFVSSTLPIESITITDILGRSVAAPETRFGAGFMLDVSQLTPGVYLLRVNKIYTEKFLKK